MNQEATDLLGVTEQTVLGLPCFQVVAGHDTKGQPFCGEDCPFLLATEQEKPLVPQTLQVETQGRTRWVQVLCIPWYPEPDGPPGLIHCALDVQSCQRMRTFLTRVARRDHPKEEQEQEAPKAGMPAPLSPREQEVLSLLVAGDDLHGVARRLHVSYVTVRNHVQHILTKLHAHSVLEVVARTLLKTSGSPFVDPRSGSE